MTEPFNENYLAEQALKKGYISSEQLDECRQLRQQGSPARSLARIFFEKGYLNDEQLGEILKEYRLTVGEMSPDDSDPGSIEFGEAVVNKGLAKNVDIWEAIEAKAQGGERLGQILIERGTLALSQAQGILESQGKKILKCAECGHQYNVKEYKTNKEYTCLNCGGPLSPPESISSLKVQGTAMDSQTVKASIDDKFVGKEIGGCEILQKLGEGGMGSVYKARHLALNKIVAVKIMSSALMGEIHRKRFLREARAAAQVEHNNIIQVHDTGVAEGYNYIVMQFIDGESIQKRINREGQFDQKEALRVIRDSADALGYAHRRHMIHRDIKPDNIMLTSESIVKVADFGLVKSTEIEKDLTGMSQSMLMGTPHYMSPEQFEGKIIDHRTDIYSLGVTLYYMLTGQKPYDGTTPYQIMQGHLQQEFVDPTNLSDEIYPEVSKLVRKMMSRDREQRYQSCEDIVSDIDKMMRGFEDGTIATGEFIVIEDDLGPTMQADVPQSKRQQPVVPEAGPAKKSAMIFILPAVLLVIVVAALLAYLFVFSDNKEKENGDKPAVVDPVPDKPDNKKAEVAFEKTRLEANKLVENDRFSDAMAKWQGFVPKWGVDPWQDKVDIQRALILEQAIKRIGELLASGAKGDLQKALSEAGKLGEINPDTKLAAFAEEADKKLKSMETAEQTRARKLAEFQVDDKRAQELKKQDKLKEARDVYDPKYVNSDLEEIKTKAGERIAEIDALLAGRNKQWADYRAAQDKAKPLMEANEYKSARECYEPFTAEKYLSEIQEDARKNIQAIDSQRGEYESLEFQKALALARDEFEKGNYPGARSLLKSYLAHPEETFSGPAKKLDSEAASYEDFWAQIDSVDAFRKEKKYGQALEIARRYEKSKNPDFQKLGSEKVHQIRKERYLDENLLFIDGGNIPIGSDDPNDRNPSRTVTVKPFYIDQTEVTNAQYYEFVKETGHKTPLHWAGGRPRADLENHPVAWVRYSDANKYCEWRSKKEGASYRLPTETEWEYAASYDPDSGKKTTYPWGDTYDGSYANIGGGKTKAAGASKRDKSPLGAFDMAGNVAEWTISDDRRTYVIRGGSIIDEGKAEAGRTSFRHQTDPGTKGGSIGFRCVREED